MASDDKVIITADEAISLLPEGDYVHNYVNNVPGIFIGCDFSRENAERHIREAVQCEIGGPASKKMRHALVVWATEKSLSFFETDMAKVEAMEQARSAA